MLHVPVLRAGQPYRSLDTIDLKDSRSGEAVARVSQANRGLIHHDLLQAADWRRALQEIPSAELVAICGRAAELFLDGTVMVDPIDGVGQSPAQFVEIQSATTGLPRSLCRANMEKIHFVLANMDCILAGLTRGLDLELLDRGHVVQDGRTVSFLGQANTMGAILPSNSPGVHSLWIPSFALKVPLVLKPGRQEPWTPMRITQALLAAGAPPEAISFYPTGHGAVTDILMRTDRSMLFGDESTLRPWQGDPRIQLHGPGWSKIIFGEDQAQHWKNHLDWMVGSIAANGGRSCVNASGVWTPAHGDSLADALAQRLAAIPARALDDPQAELAAFTDPGIARRISDFIDQRLAIPGAEDVTARYRRGGRVAEVGGSTFVLPTVIRCSDPDHPLASAELLFPFVSVVEVPQAEMVTKIGSTLVASVVSDDVAFREEMLVARNIDRLNLAAVPTNVVSWDQPHEGNLFELLYKQRSFVSGSSDSTAA
ncbi:MAG: aldehyde dehydrogenase family protein [Acidobacteriota bacterium]|nr:aldehyde dehydrogenase family protein [Acidobacteriota bacterium]MDH3785070.1 aldehyde dehydrogenase family protein [Acidobacteriota bacterium]